MNEKIINDSNLIGTDDLEISESFGHADPIGELGDPGEPSFETNKVAAEINRNLGITFTKEMLVKPLPITKVVKEKIENKLIKTSEEAGTDYPVYEPVVTGTEEVDAYFRTGIVLALPTGYQWPNPNDRPNIGDIVIYPERGVTYFDLFKDSQLINPYNVVAFGPNTCKFGANLS